MLQNTDSLGEFFILKFVGIMMCINLCYIYILHGHLDLGLKTKDSTEDQLRKLKENYDSKLKTLELPDPNPIEADEGIDDVTKWPVVTLGTIFSYILKKA